MLLLCAWDKGEAAIVDVLVGLRRKGHCAPVQTDKPGRRVLDEPVNQQRLPVH